MKQTVISLIFLFVSMFSFGQEPIKFNVDMTFNNVEFDYAVFVNASQSIETIDTKEANTAKWNMNYNYETKKFIAKCITLEGKVDPIVIENSYVKIVKDNNTTYFYVMREYEENKYVPTFGFNINVNDDFGAILVIKKVIW